MRREPAAASSLAEARRLSPVKLWTLTAAARCVPAPYQPPGLGDVPGACPDCDGCGDDAFFLGRPTDGTVAIGIADGVGGWRRENVDAGAFSLELMSNCRDVAEEAADGPEGASDPKRLLAEAYERLLKKGGPLGSSTACVATLDRYTGSVRIANLGDSGALIIRAGSCALESSSQQHEFNYPYQLVGPPAVFKDPKAAKPEMADDYAIDASDGDIIVLATDGVLDNLHKSDLLEIVTGARDAAVGEIADRIRHKAWVRSTSYVDTPFVAAAKAGVGRRHIGGKEDDITVVVARVQRLPEEQPDT